MNAIRQFDRLQRLPFDLPPDSNRLQPPNLLAAFPRLQTAEVSEGQTFTDLAKLPQGHVSLQAVILATRPRVYRGEGGTQRYEIKVSATRLVSKLADINSTRSSHRWPSSDRAYLHSCSFASKAKRASYLEALLYAVRWCDPLACPWWTTMVLSGERSGTRSEGG